MNANRNLARWRRRARVRRVAFVAAASLPLVLALAWLGLRHSIAAAMALAAAGLVAAAAIAGHRAIRIDARSIARRLDAERAELEDSAALADLPDGALNPLQRLQRERVRARIATAAAPAREPVPWRALVVAWLAASALFALAWLPSFDAPTRTVASTRDAPSGPRATRITQVALEVHPPAYTGLPPRQERTLAARVEAGSTLRWSIAVEPVPDAIALVFHDDTRVALERSGGAWIGEREITRPMLYRVEAQGVPAPAADRSHRLEVVPDRAPQIRVIEPERTLTPLAAGQRRWALAFEASDDYGVADARLTLTSARGTGENITVTRSTVALRGEGEARARRYRHEVELSPYALAPGDDLIAKLVVRDNRTPAPQSAQSASHILRAPFEAAADGSGVEGLVRDTLPAYFRSQRQIIIDTEALVAEAPKLARDALVDRSDAIGVDQRLLRLRYGQFLGEETTAGEGAHAGEGEHAAEGEAGHAEELAPGAGSRDVLEAFGHTHDDAEAATLLDPETKKLLRAALGEMWDAERRLRSGAPREALPFEHRALDYIKQVQQASRIYLARVGLELPQLDEARRLSGDRGGLVDPASPLVPATRSDTGLPAAWAALARGELPDLDALERWARANEDALPDALGWFEALERLAQDRDCADCRAALARRVWAALPVAPAGVEPQPAHDAAARAYLDALGGAPR